MPNCCLTVCLPAPFLFLPHPCLYPNFCPLPQPAYLRVYVSSACFSVSLCLAGEKQADTWKTSGENQERKFALRALPALLLLSMELGPPWRRMGHGRIPGMVSVGDWIRLPSLPLSPPSLHHHLPLPTLPFPTTTTMSHHHTATTACACMCLPPLLLHCKLPAMPCLLAPYYACHRARAYHLWHGMPLPLAFLTSLLSILFSLFSSSLLSLHPSLRHFCVV